MFVELTSLRAQQTGLVEALEECERAMSMHNDSSDKCSWDFGPVHGGSLNKARKALATLDVPPEKS